jgi:hypothetical protein
MTKATLVFSIALAAGPLAMLGQSSTSSSSFVAAEESLDGLSGQAVLPVGGSTRNSEGVMSRVAFGAGISPLGIQLEAATNLSRHFNVRATGNFFNYSDNFTTNGIHATAKLNLASARASLDVYPFHVGWRISPGVMFLNQNQVTAGTNVPAGTSFTLNDATYYSANANSVTGASPVAGSGVLGLSANEPAFTVTTGWGNQIPRSGHWSFPLEVGVAFIGDPSVKVNLGGWACADEAQTECSNIADPANPIAVAIQSNLAAQVAKWTSDLKPLNTFPIVSFGMAYSFHVR